MNAFGFHRGPGRLGHAAELTGLMLHDRGFDDDATKEVAEHPLGSPFRAIHGDDRKTIWPDLGNAILKNSVGFSDVALLLSALGSTTMTNGDHSGASHGLGG
ncbi:MAG: hypothetical protein KDA59_10195, partial [Planctomycetales bacterium]|nr:hypothetical protein [Planctomycetales bacterium]